MLKLFRSIRRNSKRLATLIINRDVDLKGSTINGICKFNKRTTFGEHCHFNGVWVDGCGPVKFGHYCHFGKNVTIFTQNHNYQSTVALPYDDTFVIKGVEFGNYVWVGSGVVILPGATIEDGVIVQAGAVVHGRLKKGGIYGGNPATMFASRDMDVFERLDRYGS